MNSCLRAELTKSDIATAEGITVRAESPILALCRKLVDAGYDPNTPLEALSGATRWLCESNPSAELRD